MADDKNKAKCDCGSAEYVIISVDTTSPNGNREYRECKACGHKYKVMVFNTGVERKE